jgi:hypothetical protein
MPSLSSIFNLTVPKLLVIRDIRLGIINRLFQLGVLFFMIYNLSYNQTFYKTEVPKGYITSMWSESNDLYRIQREYKNDSSVTKFNYCSNKDHDYIFSLPYWDYRNVSCKNLPYSFLYEKGENEFFFMTMFTENKISLVDCDNNVTRCMINDRLDGNCICQDYKNYYTVGIEGMKFVLDYKYMTSFESGSNFKNRKSNSVKTIVVSKNNKETTFQKNQNIIFSLKEWLELVDVNLDDFNVATKISEPSNTTTEAHPRYRITGLQIVINIECTNLISQTKASYGETICYLKPYINEGWASKGSSISYITYPNLNNSIVESKYYDRYRYGVKFYFYFSGEIGTFDYNSLVNTVISSIVLAGSCATILILVVSNFCCNYTEKIVEERIHKSNLLVKGCRSESVSNEIITTRTAAQSTNV